MKCNTVQYMMRTLICMMASTTSHAVIRSSQRDAPTHSYERTDAGADDDADGVDSAPDEEREEHVCAAEDAVDEVAGEVREDRCPELVGAHSTKTYLAGGG